MRDSTSAGRPGTASPILLVALLALGAIVATCGGTGASGTPTGSGGSVAASASASAGAVSQSALPSGSGAVVPSGRAAASPSGPPTSPVDGVVIDVKSAGLSKVGSFTIRTAAGQVLTFQVGRLAPGSFPAGHLTEHASTAAPVRVTFTVEGDTLVATNLADAS